MKFLRSLRIDKGVRTALMVVAAVLVIAVLRSVPVVGRAFAVVERGLVIVGTSAGNVLSRVTTPEDSLTAQLAQCEDRLRDSTEREAALADAEQRAYELETLLGYVQTAQTTAVTAHVLSRALPEAATVRIDRGAAQGVQEGDAVVVDEGHLFGTVVAVSEQFADVRLLHSRESRVPAMLLGRGRTIGLVSGQEGSLLHMEFIPQDATIEEGQTVVTSGLEGALPANLVLGTVTSVLREETSPFIEAIIEPLYDSRAWTTVLVLVTSPV